MLGRLFSKSKKGKNTQTLSTLEKLTETQDMLEKKETFLLGKVDAELKKAKAYTQVKNKRAAIQCLKKKKLYEHQIDQLAQFQLRISDQMIMLESAEVTTTTVSALRDGASVMKEMHLQNNIIDVEKTIDEINENTEHMKQIQDALSAPIGGLADFDNDELEAEFEDLEEIDGLDELLLQPGPSTHVLEPQPQPVGHSPQNNTSEEADLAALQAEMAL